MTERNQLPSREPLALVGVGCRFPGGANNVDSLWQLLVSGASAIGEVPPDRWHVDRYHHSDAESKGRMVTRRGGFVDRIKYFDAAFWGISPREAMRMDPQQRWLLETAWEACEDAGTPPSKMRGTNVGVFIGASGHDYASLQLNDLANLDVHTNTGGTLSIAANRISYMLDLKGPSIAVDTACSSALVAVALACRSIWSGECDTALAGGVNALITPNTSIGFSKASMLSPTGECFAFDSRADGYVRGEGAGIVLLKPLSRAIADHDRVYAVLRSAVVNQDGQTSSMTVPSVAGQSEMLRTAYRNAGIAPRDVAYVEAHGTGTPVGDPVEAEALGRVLSEGRGVDDVCWMGSIKTNIGHLESASGIAGLIKVALVLDRKQIPANRNFEIPNPSIPLDRYHLNVPTELRSLPSDGPVQPLASVNSFGFGGTNAHVVLQAAPKPTSPQRDHAIADRPFVLPISARDESSLREYVNQYRKRLKTFDGELADFCSSAGARKEHHEQRLTVVGRNTRELTRGLTKWLRQGEASDGIVCGRPSDRADQSVFVFTGQGSQWCGMGQRLIQREPIARETVEEIDELFQAQSGWSLLHEMFLPEGESNIQQTRVAQPAIFALQVALARLWASWGIHPTSVVGHSVGEVAAAWCAGIYSLSDAVSLIYHRSRLQNETGGAGRMLAAGVSPQEARKFIGSHGGRVQITAENSPSLVTIGGDIEPLELIAEKLEASGRFVRWLGLDYAFHTHQMEPIKDELLTSLAHLSPRPSRVPLISTVSGREQCGEQMDASYWWANVREPVRFESAMATLVAGGAQRFLEIGPHPSMRSSIDACVSNQNAVATILHSISRTTDDAVELATNLAKLHVDGAKVEWQSLNQGSGTFVPQPSYPWNYQEYWLDQGDTATRVDPPLHPLLGERLNVAKPTWQFHVDPHLFPYLNDHQIWDGIVFPAAGYAEIGLAIAAELYPGDSYAVEDLECEKALFVSETAVPIVQVVFEAETKSFTVYSSSGSDARSNASRGDVNWEVHAKGRLVSRPALPESHSIDLDELRNQFPAAIMHEDMYRDLRELGYGFGTDFSLIQTSWNDARGAKLSNPESLSRIAVSDRVAGDAAQYCMHPAVLDACFQATHGTRYVSGHSEKSNCLYLPELIGRVQLHTRAIPNEFWAHAIQTGSVGTSVEYSVGVFDEHGKPLATISRFRVARVEQADAAADSSGRLYQFKWQPQRLYGVGNVGSANLPSTQDVVAAVSESIPNFYAEAGLSEYYNEFVPRMQRIVLQLIENGVVDSGWSFSVGERFEFDQVFASLGGDETHRRLLRAELGWLTQAGLLRTHESGWQVVREPVRVEVTDSLTELENQFPRFASEVALIKATGPRLADVWCGDVDPLELLFPGGSSSMLDTFYCEAGEFSTFNRLLQVAIAKCAEQIPERRVLRVLEIGAGTGSLTRSLLDVLPPEQIEYTFTDIGSRFIADAKRNFSHHPAVVFRSLDIERDPAGQGIDPHAYDLIVATNVLHATSDLRETLAHVKSCLASEGMFAFLEVVRSRPIWDNVFGLLDGWWRYADVDLRENSPLLDRSQWQTLLADCGFDAVQSFTCSSNDEETEQAAFVTRGPCVKTVELSTATLSREPSTVLIFADHGGTGDAIAAKFERDHHRPILLRRGSEFERISESEFLLNSGSACEIQRVVDDLGLHHADLARIIHCWTLDNDWDEVTSQRLMEEQGSGVFSALGLCHALDTFDMTTIHRVYFVTRSVQQVEETDPVNGLSASPLVGFLRVANNEASQYRWTLIDLDPIPSNFDADDVFNEVTHESDEREVAYRDGRRFVNRLQSVSHDDLEQRSRDALISNRDVVPFRLQMKKAGVLEHLSLNETTRNQPGPDEIEVRVMAGGINFRDVMKALGMYPGTTEDLLWFGDDFSGVVVARGANVTDIDVGDHVAGIAPYAFRSHVTVDHRLVLRQPANISFEQAATLPTVFLTTHFAIHHVARMQAGEKILIHAAAGGIGQAAVQVAQSLGLEIFATAGTPEKRELLKSMGVAHVMNSRTVEFADQIMELTGGEGVDAVLNSLAGEFIPKSLSVLAPFGRFLEIGKIDVYENSKVGLAAFKNNISYHMIDLAQIIADRPSRIAAILADVSLRLESGTYRPLPHHVFPIGNVVDAFRFMAQGRHTGKNVLSFDGGSSSAETLSIGPCTEDGKLLRGDASYLITGGAGGFGFEIAKWMIRQGARRLVLMSRSGPREETAIEIETLRAEGITITDARGDVTNRDDVERVIGEIEADGSVLKGVVHAAMVLDDMFIADLDEGSFSKVLYPKMLGAWNLHQSTQNLSLDHFICFSSFSNVVGAARQANYNAGNSFLDSLAQHRQARGLPSLTVNWGAVLGAGFVARNQKTAEYLEGIGLQAFGMSEALDVFAEMILRDTALIGAADVDWKQLGRLSAAVGKLPMYSLVTQNASSNRSNSGLQSELQDASPKERLGILADLVAQQVAGVFGIEADKVDRVASLTQVGIDSLMAVELINRLETATGTKIPMNRILSGPSVLELSRTIMDLMSRLDSVESDGTATGSGASIDAIDFEKEARLDPAIVTTDVVREPVESPRVLLTGATGFIGAQLLSELLKTTSSDVVCLVRADDESAGRRRILDNLAKYDLQHWGSEDRIQIVVGDFSHPRMGLSDESFDQLADSVDVIYHNGASVNLALPYHALKPDNVVGTQEMLRLAFHRGLKPLHHVSTFTVYATDENRGRVILESDPLPRCEDLLYGYSQSKWVCEKMIEEARQSGLSVTIYRPGHVTGHSETGVANVNDLLHSIVRACLLVGAVPFRDLALDLTPVDYVARAIVFLSQQPESKGKDFQLTNPHPMQTTALTEWMSEGGANLELISFEDWQARLLAFSEHAGEAEEGYKLLSEVLMPRLTAGNERGIHGKFDCQQTSQALLPSGISCAPADARLISTCYGYLKRSGLLRRVDVSSASPSRIRRVGGLVQVRNEEVH
ncbi:type I polyketide synthase [Aporhodopirellula aestuarii]|uniref:Thioester reductase domain-containing protein n=1 Tax=Aporhodopirellula aestuarii TaxID=2950107 RepID=A0ABT0U075_9BACT|nr:type I polyketide synthase [Aporhodopirellula aestuarii]MCM2370264.1 thioester reductase domain-containing protein [Aporhodopirellula aestuarii]